MLKVLYYSFVERPRSSAGGRWSRSRSLRAAHAQPRPARPRCSEARASYREGPGGTGSPGPSSDGSVADGSRRLHKRPPRDQQLTPEQAQQSQICPVFCAGDQLAETAGLDVKLNGGERILEFLSNEHARFRKRDVQVGSRQRGYTTDLPLRITDGPIPPHMGGVRLPGSHS